MTPARIDGYDHPMPARCSSTFHAAIALVIGAACPPATDAQVKVTPGVLDFGDRGHMERPSAEIVIENTGKSSVTV